VATKETVRVRALKALAKKGEMTAPEIGAAIGLGHGLKPTMDQEVERGHLKVEVREEKRGLVYIITAKGQAALKNGTVDPPRAAGNGKPAAKAKAGKKSAKAKAKPAKKATKAKPAEATNTTAA
jgi:DNA-binding PadR family transcriptional regulator